MMGLILIWDLIILFYTIIITLRIIKFSSFTIIIPLGTDVIGK